jgi:capsular polysaccharide transport system permease protein
MASLRQGLRIQTRVIGALMVREMATRFGRENIGFLWIMAEPLLFASLVSLMWRFMVGPNEHGVGIAAFVVSGYIPLVMFRSSVGRCVGLFVANSSLMYHRQIKIHDFVFTRVCIEVIGHMMAYVAIAATLWVLNLFPTPADFGTFLAGLGLYALFTLSVCFILAPLSELSSVMEKLVPVTTYMMVPFSGSFNMVAWLNPKVRDVMAWSPPVNAMELMRAGLFGDAVRPYYNVTVPLVSSMVCLVLGLALCRYIRRHMVVE